MSRLPSAASPDARDARDWVTPEHLNVAPQLLGAPLARPRQRLLAISVDVLVVGLLSNLGNLWLLAGMALPVLMHLYRRDRRLGVRRRRIGWVLAAVLLAVGAQQAWVAFEERPQAARAQAALTSADNDAEDHAEAAPAGQAQPFDLKRQLSAWADEAGLGLGWAIAYFSLLPAWWNGQTLGKRLFGLRVVELTGKPLTVMIAFKRYGGYAAGVATGLFGFAQVFWDDNRQAIQDKTAHTVVIDLKRASRTGLDAAPDDRTLSPPHTIPIDQEP